MKESFANHENNALSLNGDTAQSPVILEFVLLENHFWPHKSFHTVLAPESPFFDRVTHSRA